jgi:hypothetical protein
MNFIASRLRNRQAIRNSEKGLYTFDPVLGFWGQADIERTITSGISPPQPDIFVSHNSDGNRDIAFEARGSKGSLVCIGGSHSWGAGVDQESRYSDFLRQAIGRQVVNMGHCSLGLDQVCIAILNRTAKFDPKIIIVEQYPWSIVRLLNGYVNGYVKPLFSLDAKGELQLKKVPQYVRWKPVRRGIGVYYAYRKELNEFRSGIDLASQYDPMTDPIFLHWKADYYNAITDLAGKVIAVMRDYCRQNGIRLIFALGAIFQEFQSSNPSRLIDYSLPRKRFQTTLTDLSVPYVDMYEPMMAAHRDDDPVVFADGHLNKKGHEIFSDVMLADLKSRAWL